MAITMKIDGMEELGKELAKLGEKAQDIASGALFDGAGIMANALNNGVNSIETAPFRYAPPGQTRLPSPQEKAAISRKIGIAKFKKEMDSVDTIVGMGKGSGYAQVAGKKKAVLLIARSINSGTSFMKKQPFFRKAVSSGSGKASAAIVQKIEEAIKENTK